jgi:hypothetical protein
VETKAKKQANNRKDMNYATNRGSLRSRQNRFAEIKSAMCNLYQRFTTKAPTDREIDRYVDLAWLLQQVSFRRRFHPEETGDGLRSALRRRFPAP